MDDLVREMKATIEEYKSKADKCFEANGVKCHVLVTREGEISLQTTFPRWNFYQSPVDAERQHGLTGIAGGYKMPAGLKPIELQAYAEILRHAAAAGEMSYAQMDDKLDQVLGMLAARNPQAAGLTPNPEDKLSRYNIVLGIASEYNAKDIQYFVDAQPDMANNSDPKYWSAWSKLADLQLGWMPAPETLFKIEQQVDARPGILVQSKFARQAAQEAVMKAIGETPPEKPAAPRQANGK